MKFVSTQDISLIYSLLLIRKNFPTLFTPQDDETIIQKLARYTENSGRADEERILVAEWLRGYPLGPKSAKTLAEYLHPHHLLFYPTTFDSFAVKEALLRLLISSFEPSPSKLAPPE